MLAAGLLFRLILAYALPGLRGSGFGPDLGLFNYWADVLAEHGPWGFYANASYADYTPGYLYALWLVGIVRDFGTSLAIDPTIVDSVIKLPAIITDLVLGYLVYALATDLGVTHRRALVALAVVVFNPVTWFDSVIWGQVDSFGTVFLLLGVRELWRGRSERAAFFAVVAALVKPQLAILVPIVALVVIRRALWPEGGYGDEPEPPRRGFAWELRPLGWVRIVTTGVVGFLTAVLLSAPFGLTVIGVSTTAPYLDSSLLRLVFSTAATYPYLTVNAYNWWSLFPVDGQSAATAGGALWIPDAARKAGEAFGAIGPLPAGARGRRAPAGRGRARGLGRGPAAGPAHDPRRRHGPRARVLRRPDAGPRAVPVPVLRARGDPVRLLVALADRVRDRLDRDVREHVRRPRGLLPEPARIGLAGHQRGAALDDGRLARRGAPHRSLPVGPRAAATRRPRDAGGRARRRPVRGAPG